MSFEQQNRKAVVAYFNKGAKGDAPLGALGVEVEHFVVAKQTHAPITYTGGEAGFGVRDVLAHLATWYPEKTFSREGDLIGLASPKGSITLEPAAQLEISIAPYMQVTDVLCVYNEFRSQVDPFLEQHGCELMALGYHPTAKALSLELIPKQRYRFMNNYFHEIGTHGERMMRASASTQVSVDYRDEADAIRKMRVAQALAPILSAMTQNTPVFEAEPAAPMARFALWRDVDNDRCGSVPGLFNPGFGFEAYAEWVLQTCPIFVTRAAALSPEGPELRAVYGQSAYRAYSDAPMSEADVEHVLSMFWPDVRLKSFVEIRPADSLPAPVVAGYTALVKGLFYSEESLQAIEQAFGVQDDAWPLNDESANKALALIQQGGLQANLYGKTLAEWESFLFGLAGNALPEQEKPYLQALAKHAASQF